MTVNKVCGSGLKAVALAAQAIRAGDAEVVVAGGMENMSAAPYLLEGARDGLAHGRRRRGRLDGPGRPLVRDRATATWASPPRTSRRATRSRVRSRTRFAAESQRRAAARDRQPARSRDEIVPRRACPRRRGDPVVVTRDEHPRPDTTAEGLARLRPAFDGEGTVTAGNASGINDGAAAMVVMSRERAEALGLAPLAAIALLCLGRRGPAGDGHRARSTAVAQRAGAGRPGRRRRRPGRAQRGLRRAVAGRGARAGARPGADQRATAARSRSAIPSAPGAPASS